MTKPAMDEPGQLGIFERLFERQTCEADITADAFSAPQEFGLLALRR